MANRYWVGGAGTWDTTSTTHWSTASGGSAGASVPTAADSVFFDQAGTYTVTCTGALTCLDITVSAGTVTFATGTSPTFAISGSMSLIAGTVWSSGAAVTFNATTTGKTITTNGVSISGNVTFNGVGGGWTLGSALTTPGFFVTAGSFDTGNYNLSGSSFNSTGSTTRSITLGSSTLTYNASGGVSLVSTGLTFNAGTSQINLSGASSSQLAGSGLTFYNVAFTSASATSITITGANTFNTLSFAGRTTQGIGIVSFAANQTISTLTLNAGTNATYRTFLQSDTIGTQRTLSVGTFTAGAADYDFRDIAITGAASPISGTRFGDCKGNSGITFPAGVNKYWNLAAGGSWGGSSGWALTSGGATGTNYFPLAQDTCIFDVAGLSSGSTVSFGTPFNIGTIDMSARNASNTMTLSCSGACTIYGNWINGTGVTTSGTATQTFSGRNTQIITSAGRTMNPSFTVNSPGGTTQLQDAFTATGITTTITLTSGTLDLNGFTLTAAFFSCTGGTLAFGSGNITLTTAGTIFTGSPNTTVTGTPNVYVTYSGATAVTINPGLPTESNSINFIITAGSYTLTVTSGTVFRNLDFSNGGTSTFTGVFALGTSTHNCTGSLTLNPSMTTTGSSGGFNLSATSGTKTITTNGVTFNKSINFIGNSAGSGATWQLQSALTLGSTFQLFLTDGTFDANGYNVTASRFDAGSTGVTRSRTVNIGSGTWTLSAAGATVGTAPWVTASTTNGTASGLTVTGTGTLSFTAATQKFFGGGGLTYPKINQGGAGDLRITAIANTFSDITNTYNSTGATTISFGASATQTVSAFSAAGTSAKLLSLISATAGTQATIALSGGGTVSTDYLNVQDIAFTPGPAADGSTPYVWYLGANSTNSGNNTGGLFQAGGAGAIKVYQITNTATTSWTVPSDWNSSSNTIHLIGGGGGGGGARATSTTNKAGGAGGGGGGYTAVTNYSTTPSSSITVAVGAGGTAGASAGGTGGTGGTTSWATINTATGGTGGSTTIVPSSIGGIGGLGTYSGGAGGAGSTTTTSSVIVTGGGGGGTAGPNGAGGTGGNGFASSLAANTAGGGGGGNGGGTSGGNASSATGGTGGNNSLGTGGGASNTAGTIGGGGGGGVATTGKVGGAGIDILNTVGGGGGAGGSGGSLFNGVAGSAYGSGGSGGTTTTSTGTGAGGAGAKGLIVIAYTPSVAPSTNSNFFLLL